MEEQLRAYLEFFGSIGVQYVRTDLPGEGGSAGGAVEAVRTDGETLGGRSGPVGAAAALSLFADAPRPDTLAPSEAVADPVTAMQAARNELGDCVRCKLHRYRTQIVFGTGSVHAELMFVGEAPGADEDEQGIPFVGRAGQLLTRIIESIRLRREDVYIANIIKCRPPQNRNPEADEIAACSPFLLRQISVIRPRIICALGKFAAQTLLETQSPISQLRGKVFDRFGARIIPTFHPSYLLRNPAAKREVWEDMKAIRKLLDDPRR
ncbi:MAG: uracil-DNA glycosylase [Acidobacteria bacterium]|nr:uracil-DNA glycosylase [Acidobacteriota bacterium]